DLPDSNEYSPSMRGSVVAFISDLSGTPLTYVIDFADSSPTAIAQTPAATSVHGQAAPVVDYTTVGWIDGRAITTAEAPVTADWDIFGAPFQSSGSYAAFPGENPVATASGPQILRDIESGFFVW